MDYFEDNIEDLEKIINHKNIILKFYAEWCKNCNLINEDLKNYSEKYNFMIININIDNNESLMDHYEISKLPTIIINEYNNNKEKIIGLNAIKSRLQILEINEDF
jgi:thiol-disulfide isomerase/thioredoxin